MKPLSRLLPSLSVFPTLNWYIARQFFLALMATLLILLGLVVLLDYIELLRRAGNSLSSGTLFLMAFFKAPQTIESLLPFAGLIGAMVSLWRFTRSHELVVIRAAGVSVWQFLTPALAVVLCVGAIEVTLVNPFSANLYKHFQQMEDSLILRRGTTLTLSQTGLWLRQPLPLPTTTAASSAAPTAAPTTTAANPATADNHATLIIHAKGARQVADTLAMSTVSFFYTDVDGHFAKMIQASEAVLDNGTLHLSDAWTVQPNRPGVHADRMDMATTLTMGGVQDHFASPETISFWRLPGFIAFFDSVGFSTQRFRLHWISLLASPFQLCAMVILATAFTASPNQRSGRGMIRIAGGIGTGFLVFFFSQITQALGLNASLPLWVAAWSPTVATLLLASGALLYLEDG